jgi:DNA-binding response OmpR family regulator
MRVLIVDDDPELLTSCGVGLALAGHHPTGALEPGLGLATATREPADVILISAKLGGGAPAWLLRALRRDRVTPKVPVLVYSADPNVGEELLAWQLGADAFLTRPREPRILCAAVESVAHTPASERARRRDAIAGLGGPPPHTPSR